MPNRIQNQKNALVTGAARGIGRAIALSLAKEGYNVAVLYLGSEEAAEQTCDEIRQLGRQALCIRCDVACGESCRQAVAQVIEEFGSIDVLVNNAGIVRDSLVLSMKEEDFEQVVQTNLNGAFYMIKHTCRQFIKNRRGRIINISSVTGVMGNAGQANYASAKAGLIGLTKSVARELAGRNITCNASKAGVIGMTKAVAREMASRGITCNAVAPGFVATDMTAAMPQKILESAVAQVPLGRMGTAEEIAQTVAFLCSDAAGYITGQVLCVDGGLSM